MRVEPNGILLVCSEEAEAQALLSQLEDEGWRVFQLRRGIDSDHAFFQEMRDVFPLDPPVHSDYSWDALGDSFWEGLFNLADQRIAIAWPDLLNSEWADLDVAYGVLIQNLQLLTDFDATVGKPKKVCLVGW